MIDNIDLPLCEYAEDDLSSSPGTWAGVYTLIEVSDKIVRIFRSSKTPDKYDLFKDPKLEGAIDYKIYEIRKKRGRDTYYAWSGTGGYYMYHSDETMNDFINWFRSTEGYTIDQRVFDYEKYGDGILS